MTTTPRATKYGFPITPKGDALTPTGTSKAVVPAASHKKPKTYPNYAANGTSYGSKFKPVSEEVTNYGAKKFRTPYSKNQFVGRKGSPQKVVILDIDGTLQGWGSGGDKDVMKWVKKHYDKKTLLVVVTARGDSMYDTSFNWLMRNMPFPFIGPFCRNDDDPRYASEFKRELVQGFVDAGTWEVVGAADDNKFVIDMWKKWAVEHPETKDFDLLECDTYADYDGWRDGLGSKGNALYDSQYGWPKSNYSNTSYPKNDHKGEKWVNGYTDKTNGKWVAGGWVKDDPKPKPTTMANNPWKKTDDLPLPGAPVDISADPRWQYYFAQRTRAGDYAGDPANDDVIIGEVVDPVQADLDAVLAEIELDREGHSLRRDDLLAIVRYEYPGYEDKELDEMDTDELCELAGLTANAVVGNERWDDYLYGDKEEGLFEDWHLVLPGEEVHPDERDVLITERMEMEEEVYASDWALRKSDFATMTFEQLFTRQAELHEQLERHNDAIDESGDPQTQPLDVSEVLADGEAQDFHVPVAWL